MTDNGAMSYTESAEVPKEGSEPIKLSDEQRIEKALNTYLTEGINYGANTIKNADVGDLQQLASDSFHAGAIAERERMNKLYSTKKESFLARTSFKNVSGNWQFKGDITPERVFQVIARQLKEERNKAIDALEYAIERLNDFDYSKDEYLSKALESLNSDSK